VLNCALPIGFLFSNVPAGLNGYSQLNSQEVVLEQTNFDRRIVPQKVVYNQQVVPLFQTQTFDLTEFQALGGQFNLGLFCLFDLQLNVNSVFQVKYYSYVEYFNQAQYQLNLNFFNQQIQQNNVLFRQVQIPQQSQIQIIVRNIAQGISVTLPKFKQIQVNATLYESQAVGYKITQVANPYKIQQAAVAADSILNIVISNPTPLAFQQDVQIKQIQKVYSKSQLITVCICYAILALIITYNLRIGFLDFLSILRNRANDQEGGIGARVYPATRKKGDEGTAQNIEMKKLQ
jgi:hypothetical protein